MNNKLIFFSIILCILLTFFSGCENQIDNEKPETPSSQGNEVSAELGTLSNLMSLGNYGESIILDGSQREPDIIKKSSNSFILPAGRLISIVGRTSGTVQRFIDIEPNDAKDFILEIEKSKIISEEDAINPKRKQIGAEIQCLLLNSLGEHFGIRLSPFSDGMTNVSIWYQDDRFKEDRFFVYSESLINQIKELSEWKIISLDTLSSAVEANCTNINTNLEYKLTYSELKDLIFAINNGKETNSDSKCPFNIKIELTLKDRQKVNMLWCGDSCAILGIEGTSYQIDRNYSDSFCKLLKENEIQKYQ